MRAVAGRPSARAFSGTRKRVEIPQADILTCCLIGHLPDIHIGMEDRNGTFGDRGEVEIKQLARDINHSVCEFIQL